MLAAKTTGRRDIAMNQEFEVPPAPSGRFRGHRPGSPMKRISDVAISGALIAFTLPLMAAVALLIKLDSAGPVLMREERGWDGDGGGRSRRAAVLKFRTTVYRPQRSASAWARQEELTRIGRFLYYTRLADLPQLVNVLRGEMSLVDAGAVRPDFFA
jgi:lipopolysaccharide/colanic/teichoic acid biosynthesis glycosyltransferase